MQIKHNKYKNTGLIFELLVKQVTADILEDKNSPAGKILQKYYKKNSELVKEHKLYRYIVDSKSHKITESRANTVLTTVLEVAQTLKPGVLKSTKYDLIKEIKQHYDINHFFSRTVKEYTPLAALYCLLEIYKSSNKSRIKPKQLIQNKSTLLEYLTKQNMNQKQVQSSILENYNKFGKDLKLLTFKILLEKYNKKYSTLLPTQKAVLKEYINSIDSKSKLKEFHNKEITKIKTQVKENLNKIEDEVLQIKIKQILQEMKEVGDTRKVEDKDLIKIMGYQNLLHNMKSI